MFGTEPGLSYASKQHHLINKFESYLVQREYFRWEDNIFIMYFKNTQLLNCVKVPSLIIPPKWETWI